jgi:hypothetical protein
MNKKYDFREFTKLPATKANAIKLCGEDFIDKLTAQKIFAKDELFWEEICKLLNIPDIKKQEEERLENLVKEKERLLKNKKLFDTKEKQDWKILIFELPDSDILGKQYLAEAYKNEDEIKCHQEFYWGRTPNQAFSKICNFIHESEKQAERSLAFNERYIILKYIYLLLLYLSGHDDHATVISKQQKNKENFLGIQSWINLDFEILNRMEIEKLLSQPQRGGNNYKKVTYARLSKKGIIKARDILKNIDLGIETLFVQSFLDKRSYHDDYISYQGIYDNDEEE